MDVNDDVNDAGSATPSGTRATSPSPTGKHDVLGPWRGSPRPAAGQGRPPTTPGHSFTLWTSCSASNYSRPFYQRRISAQSSQTRRPKPAETRTTRLSVGKVERMLASALPAVVPGVGLRLGSLLPRAPRHWRCGSTLAPPTRPADPTLARPAGSRRCWIGARAGRARRRVSRGCCTGPHWPGRHSARGDHECAYFWPFLGTAGLPCAAAPARKPCLVALQPVQPCSDTKRGYFPVRRARPRSMEEC